MSASHSAILKLRKRKARQREHEELKGQRRHRGLYVYSPSATDGLALSALDVQLLGRFKEPCASALRTQSARNHRRRRHHRSNQSTRKRFHSSSSSSSSAQVEALLASEMSVNDTVNSKRLLLLKQRGLETRGRHTIGGVRHAVRSNASASDESGSDFDEDDDESDSESSDDELNSDVDDNEHNKVKQFHRVVADAASSDAALGSGAAAAAGDVDNNNSNSNGGDAENEEGDGSDGDVDEYEEPLVAMAGRSVLRVLRFVAGRGFKSVANLRTNKRSSLNYSAIDVKWHPSDGDRMATAATNGAIVVWQDFVPESQRLMKDHDRTVNKVNWHPSHSHMLLSASQDGTMRLFDLREPKYASALFKPRSDSVRDAQFSPFFANYFAAAFDNGTIQLWDIRQPARYWRKINAHDRLVLSLAWHPSQSNLLASGGRDRAIKIWNLRHEKPKPAHTIQTTSSVGSIQWRPGVATHIASAASLMDNSVYVWDYTSPHIPFLQASNHSDVVSDLLFYKNDPMRIVSCSKDCSVQLSHLSTVHRPFLAVNTAALSWNVRNQLGVVNDPIDRARIYAEFAVDDSKTVVAVGDRQPRRAAAVMPSPNTLLALYCSPSMPDPEFSSTICVGLARNYLLRPKTTLAAALAHNERVAAEWRRPQIAKMWALLATLASALSSASQQQRQAGAEAVATTTTTSAADPSSSAASTTLAPADSLSSAVESISHVPPMSLLFDGAAAQLSSSDSDVDEEFNNDGYILTSQEQDFLHSLTDAPQAALGLGDDIAHSNLAAATAVAHLNRAKTSRRSRRRAAAEAAAAVRADSNESLGAERNQRRHRQQRRGGGDSNPSGSGDNAALLAPRHSLFDSLCALSSSQSSSSSPANVPSTPMLSSWDYTPLVLELFRFHSDRGDVQTCCVMASVLGEQRMTAAVDGDAILRCFGAYIELLQRLRAWTCVADVVRSCPWHQIRKISQTGTTLHSGCGRCRKSLLLSDVGSRCPKCTATLAPCSICRRAVRGHFVWCSGCGHGGHIEHMRQWFAAGNDFCPTGCNHRCNLRLSKP
jgi:SEA/GATOR complex protein SEA2/WDR24